LQGAFFLKHFLIVQIKTSRHWKADWDRRGSVLLTSLLRHVDEVGVLDFEDRLNGGWRVAFPWQIFELEVFYFHLRPLRILSVFGLCEAEGLFVLSLLLVRVSVW
jgi:hypothetical protein